MASPQLENGFFKIANEIAEALMRTNLSAYHSRILWAIFRKTYGFEKKEDWISNSQMIDLTGLLKSHISRSIKELKERNLVTKRGNKISFNKDYQQWRELPKGVTSHHELPKGVTQLPKGVTKVTKRGVHKRIQYTKDILRDSPNPAIKEFIDFWFQTFQEKFGSPYLVNGSKEGPLVKKMLAIHPLERLKSLAGIFFGSTDPFVKNSGYTIGAFYSQVHKSVVAAREQENPSTQTDTLRQQTAARVKAMESISPTLCPPEVKPAFLREEAL